MNLKLNGLKMVGQKQYHVYHTGQYTYILEALIRNYGRKEGFQKFDELTENEKYELIVPTKDRMDELYYTQDVHKGSRLG